MNIEDFLSRLEKVKKTPSGWLACCPAHNDHSPSMTVGIARSSGLLVHCFGGCSPYEIMGSVGLNLSDLMPETRPDEVFKKQRFPVMDAFRALRFHAMVIAVAAIDAANGKKFSAEDKDTLLASAAAIHEAYGMVA